MAVVTIFRFYFTGGQYKWLWLLYIDFILQEDSKNGSGDYI